MRKKGIGKVLGIMIATMLLAGCGGNESQEGTERGIPDQKTAEHELAVLEATEQEATAQETENYETADGADADVTLQCPQSGNNTAVEGQNRLVESRIIQEHSFPVELNGWGEVRFVSYEPDDSVGADPWEDVSFYLLRDGEILYQFPYIGSGLNSDYGSYYDMTFVMFTDTNEDGRKDVVIGAQYMTGAGPQGAIPHTVVRIYEDCGDYFTYNEGLSEKIYDYLPWESNVIAEDVKRLLKLIGKNETLTNYESYSGKWMVGAGAIAAYEDPKPASRNELTCTIRNGNEFTGNMFAEQGGTERFASVDGITGKIEDGELFYEFTDDGWGGAGRLHIMFLPNQITVEVLDYRMAEENASGYGISGSYEMIRAYAHVR